MFGNYPVNDDWIFVRQVDAFSKGIFKLSAEIDPSFITQGLLGYLWSKIFGAGFVSLQVLTFLITLIGIFGIILTLRELGIKGKKLAIVAVLVFFNPLILASAFTFMTDNYLVTFLVYSIYFCVRFLNRRHELRDFMFCLVFIFLASLTRQTGLLVGIALIVTLAISHFRKRSETEFNKRFFGLYLPFVLITLILGYFVPSLWPKFGQNRVLILPGDLLGRIRLFTLSLHYIPFFIFPLFFGLSIPKFKSGVFKVLYFFLTVAFAVYLYLFDFFPVGNVLYIEGLYLKSDFRTNFSIFDNALFKLAFALVLGLAFSKFILFTKDKLSGIKLKFRNLDETDLFLISLFTLNYIVLLISSDFYDRYLLPSFVCLLIFFLKKFSRSLSINRVVVLSSVLLVFISFTLQWEFYQQNRLKWAQAAELSKNTGYTDQIYINDTYSNYIMAKKREDYTGLQSRRAFEKKCYVQQYTLDSGKGIQSAEELMNKYIENTKPFNSKKKQDISRAKNNLDRLAYNNEYFSLLYNTVGKKAYVGSWCNSE